MAVKLVRKGRGSLYIQIRDILTRRISSGEMAPGRLLPSINELCAEFGVSAITVRQAMDMLAQEGLIGTYPGRGAYVRDGRVTHKNVALISIGDVDEMSHSFEFVEITHSIQGALACRGSRLSVVFMSVNPDGPVDSQKVREVESQGYDGFLSLCHWPRTQLAQYLSHVKAPTVCLTQDFPGAHVDNVIADNRGGSEGALAYLVALGHRRIAYFNMPARYCGRGWVAREEGYKAALEEFGIPFDPSLVYHAYHSDLAPCLAAALRGDNPPTAIMAANDKMAAVLMSMLMNVHGISVPDQMSLIGYHDIPGAALLSPPLTTVSVPWKRIGETGVDMLFSRMEKPDKAPQTIVLETRLVRRGTCSPGPYWPGHASQG